RLVVAVSLDALALRLDRRSDRVRPLGVGILCAGVRLAGLDHGEPRTADRAMERSRSRKGSGVARRSARVMTSGQSQTYPCAASVPRTSERRAAACSALMPATVRVSFRFSRRLAG